MNTAKLNSANVFISDSNISKTKDFLDDFVPIIIMESTLAKNTDFPSVFFARGWVLQDEKAGSGEGD